MPIVTLLTDFGLRDTYVGQMKGVIAAIAPAASLIDLTHQVPPQDLVVGAVALDAAVDAFPTGTVHLAVVDPGVGTARQAVAVRTERLLLVGPDNGLFTCVLDRDPLLEAVRLEPPAGATATFHGRDVFASAAARLAAGTPLAELGPPAAPLIRLDLPQPRELGDALEIHVLYADHFGNLVTDLTRQTLHRWHPGPPDHLRLTLGHTTLHGLHQTFSDVPIGKPLAYIGSSGRLEIAVRNGSAAARFPSHTTITLHARQ